MADRKAPRFFVESIVYDTNKEPRHRQSIAQIDPAAYHEIEDCFRIFDRTNSGTVPVDQIGHMLRALNQFYTWSDIDDLKADLAEIGLEQVNLQKFVEIVEQRFAEVPDGFAMKSAFHILDKDRRHQVNVAFLKHLVVSTGDVLEPEEFDVLLRLNIPDYRTVKELSFEDYRDLCLGVNKSSRTLPMNLPRLSEF